MTKRPNPAESGELITPQEAAELLSVSVRTLSRMADRHEIEVRKLPSGHRRYVADEIKRIAQGKAA